MYVRLNARNHIVEATDTEQDSEYVCVPGTVAELMPNGLLGFNGTVSTPNYALNGETVVERTEEDKARDPYSDESPEPSGDLVSYDELAAAIKEGVNSI